MPIFPASCLSEAYGAGTLGPPTLWLLLHSMFRMWVFRFRHLGAALDIQSDDKAALRRDRPIKTICSRSPSSLPEDQMVFSPACRYSVWYCAMGRDQRPFRGSWAPAMAVVDGPVSICHILASVLWVSSAFCSLVWTATQT